MMNVEKVRFDPLNNREGERVEKPPADIEKARLEPLNRREGERVAKSFRNAVNESLIPLVESFRKQDKTESKIFPSPSIRLSAYEREIWQRFEADGKIPSLRFLIDIDGVLVDTDEKINAFIHAFMHGAVKDVIAISREKIGFSELRSLIRCRNAASGSKEKKNISIITDRFSAGVTCFPCFNDSERQSFEKHHIDVRTMVMKPISGVGNIFPDGDELRDDLIYYFGSSHTDEMLARRLRAHLAESGESSEKLIYVEIRPHEKRNVT
ncbi:MAG: hypothetical protein WCL23_04015 [Candidatus Moraniibacteriota bacterium]